MIVKCEQCQTRFKIPDDKVTDKGVKVRCTKCGHTFRVTRDMAQPATLSVPPVAALPSSPPPESADPFSRFGAAPDASASLEVTRPGVFALGVEASRSPDLGTAVANPHAKPTVPQMPAVQVPGGFDFASLKPPGATAPTMPAAPVAVPPPAAPSPFDFSAMAPAGSAAAPAGGAFDFAAIAPPSQPASQVPSAFDFNHFGAPAAVAAPPVPGASAPPAMPSAFDFTAPVTAPPVDPFAAAPPFPQGGSPFGTEDYGGSPGAGAMGAVSSIDSATARSMFDLPAPAATLPEVPPPEPEFAAPVSAAPVALGAVSAPSVLPTPAVHAAVTEAPRGRSVVGVIVNIGLAAVLVLAIVVVLSVVANDGKFSAESVVESVKNLVAPSVDFVASDVSNGLYETRAGRSVFFVRGEVTNRSQASVKVVVKAELVEGDRVVRSAESYAGGPATPEEIHLIDGPDALETLTRRVEGRAVVVPPEASAPFVVPFTEYPPELRGFRVRVTAHAVPAGTASR